MKKYIAVFLVILVSLNCSESKSSDHKNPEIYLSPDEVVVQVGGETHFDLILENLDKSYFAISLRIDYDPEFVSFNRFLNGDIFSDDAVSFINHTGAEIHISISLTKGQSEINKDGTIGTIYFVSKLIGLSSVNLFKEDINFYDSSGNVMPIDDLVTVNAVIKVE